MWLDDTRKSYDTVADTPRAQPPSSGVAAAHTRAAPTPVWVSATA